MPSKIGFCVAVSFGLATAALIEYFHQPIAVFGHLPSGRVEMVAGYELILTLALPPLYGYMRYLTTTTARIAQPGRTTLTNGR